MNKTFMKYEILWQNDFSSAYKLAQKYNKPVFVDWADLPSCLGCISLENNTYQQQNVIDLINTKFIPLQINQKQNLDLFEKNKIIWTPTVSLLDFQGIEQMRWVGYLPPDEFLAKTKFALAWLNILSRNYQEANSILNEIITLYKNTLIAPEAMYWFGVLKWKKDRDFPQLSEVWNNLINLYPNSEAAKKASCL